MIENIQEEFNRAIDIRQRINNVFWKEYSHLGKVFGALFNEDEHALKKVSDMNYYRGGYPGENSPPKLETLMKHVGVVAKYYDTIGRLDELNSTLRPYGFIIEQTGGDVHIDPRRLDELNLTRPTIKAKEKVMAKYGAIPLNSAEETINWFLDKTHSLQGVICMAADEIKITIFEEVEPKLESVDKSGFVQAVNLSAARKTKVDNNKDAAAIIEKSLDRSEVLKKNGEFLRETVIHETT
jgi:hypothetical protein